MNVQSISNKIILLNIFLSKLKPIFLCVCEHWLTQLNIDMLQIEGYSKTSSFCRSSHIHGGTAIYVKNSILGCCKNLSHICNLSLEMHFEVSAISYNNNTCIASVYRSPSGNFKIFCTQISKLFQRIVNKFKYIFVCGDFNIDKNESINFKILSDIFKSFNFTSLINSPTRIVTRDGRTASSSIDYVITNAVEGVNCFNYDPGISDHHVQILYCNLIKESNQISLNKKIKYRNINGNTVAKFKTLWINSFNSQICQGADNINCIFGGFITLFLKCFEKAFPQKSRTIKVTNKKNNNVKFSDDLKEKLDRLRNLNILKKSSNSIYLHTHYKNLKREINKQIVGEKQAYISSIIRNSSNKSKALWKFVNSALGRDSINKCCTELIIDDTIIKNPKDIVQNFGYYFTTIVDKKLHEHFENSLSDTCTIAKTINNTSIFVTPFSKNDIIQIINHLSNKKSCGHDEIPISLIKQCSLELAEPIAEIINKSLVLGEFPDTLKIASVTPILKKGDSRYIENYRPISILSSFSKIIEKAVSIKITEFLNFKKIFTVSQHGFRQKRSTETATIEYIQLIYDKLDINQCVVTIFFDLSRAFDTIDIAFVANKIEAIGIRGTIKNWLISYLSNRKVQIKMGEHTSNIFNINYGTPQGSILGPLIFLMYINDLPDYIEEGSVFMYADDTSLVVSGLNTEDLEHKTKIALQSFDQWCYKNKLIINYEKTVCLTYYNIHRQPYNLKLSLKGLNLTNVDHTKFLGTTLDKHLSFVNHIDSVCSHLQRAFFAIVTLKNSLKQEDLLNVYYSLVYCHLNYNVQIWGQSVESNRVFILQKRIIRLMYNIQQFESCRNVFKTNNILTLTSIYLLKILTYIHINKNKYLLNSDFHKHETRLKDVFRLKKPNHTFYKKSPIYAGCDLYNKLTPFYKSIGSVKTFKIRLKTLLSQNSIYNIDEFLTLIKNDQM